MSDCREVYAGVNYSDSLNIALKMSLIFSYAVVFVLSLVHLIEVHRAKPNTLTTQKLFTAILLTVSLMRVIFLPLPTDTYNTMDPFVAFLVHSMPAALYFSSFVLLILYWAVCFSFCILLSGRISEFSWPDVINSL